MEREKYIGKKISEINYEQCQYRYEPIVYNEDKTKIFKVWLLSPNVNDSKQKYYYLLVFTDKSNQIIDIKTYVGIEGNDCITKELPFSEDYIARLDLESLTDISDLETEYFVPFYGLRIDEEKLTQLGYYNNKGADTQKCKEYYYCNADYWDDREFIQKYGVSQNLLQRWKENNIDFSVYFYVKDGLLKGVKLYRAKVTYYEWGNPKTEVLNVTKQEYKVARNIIKAFLL